MSDNTIMILLGFVVTTISIMTPIIKLNSSITKLNVTIDNMNCNMSKSEAQVFPKEEKPKEKRKIGFVYEEKDKQ